MGSRRRFLKSTLAAGSLAAGGVLLPTEANARGVTRAPGQRGPGPDDGTLKRILAQPILKRELFRDPVVIESLELLKIGDAFVTRARARDGAEGYAVANWGMNQFWPIFMNHVGPFFAGKDARDLDELIQLCFLADSHYKMQSMAIWSPIAAAEFAVLDLLGQVSGRSVQELLGGRARSAIDVYWANNYRGLSAEESVRRIVEQWEKARPPAVKFKIAGRMGEPEIPPGRSERMIPMLRAALGDDVVIYADANGGYDVEEAIRIGRMLEEIRAGFFEEPCPFDQLWETKEVADALSIPIAAGEQESSTRRFRWMVANEGAQVLQPDLFYFGGLIRSIQVARMAEAGGLPCTAHVSGGDLGMLYIVHFASIVANPGPHQEYKDPSRDIPFEIPGGGLRPVDGRIEAPTGPGLGVSFDPEWLRKGQVVTAAGPV